jgi:hypothetical protein
MLIPSSGSKNKKIKQPVKSKYQADQKTTSFMGAPYLMIIKVAHGPRCSWQEIQLAYLDVYPGAVNNLR